MSTSVELSAGLLKKFMEFTRKLTPDELERVVSGELKFGLQVPATPKVLPKPIDAEHVRLDLVGLNSRDAAREYLDTLRLTLAKLKDLAKALDAPTVGATTKDGVRDRIVEHVVGVRLNSHTIRHGAWSS